MFHAGRVLCLDRIIRWHAVFYGPPALNYNGKIMKEIYKSIAILSFLCSGLFSQAQHEHKDWQPPKSADSLVNPMGGSVAGPAAKKIFEAQCMPCHGKKGKGDGPVGLSLDPRPYNLTLKKVGEETDGALFWRITNGHLTMPTFKTKLTAMERWQVVSYIRLLQKEAEEEAKQKTAKANKK